MTNVRDIEFIVDVVEEIEFEFDCQIVVYEGVKYKGTYDVIPNFKLQKLETNNMLMDDDVRVHQIPVEKTTNKGGGYTVLIGGN